MLVRIDAFIRLRVRKHQIRLYMVQFGLLSDLIAVAESIVTLFRDGVIGDTDICAIDADFFHVEYSAGWRHLHRISCYQASSRRLVEALSAVAKAEWAMDFPLFVGSLIERAHSRELHGLSYFLPVDGEVGLSKYLFGSGSPHRFEVDSVVSEIGNRRFDDFSDRLLAECYRLIPNRLALSPSDESIALLIF
jgi:hypothetical protein